VITLYTAASISFCFSI